MPRPPVIEITTGRKGATTALINGVQQDVLRVSSSVKHARGERVINVVIWARPTEEEAPHAA